MWSNGMDGVTGGMIEGSGWMDGDRRRGWMRWRRFGLGRSRGGHGRHPGRPGARGHPMIVNNVNTNFGDRGLMRRPDSGGSGEGPI